MSNRSVAGTTPYPWPYDGVLDPARTALVITGAGRTWSSMVPDDPERGHCLVALRRGMHRVGVLVVLVDHDWVAPRGSLRSAVDPTAPLTPAHHEHSVVAVGVDGFYGSSLDALLQRHRRDHLLVCGHGLETTVHSTVRRANDRGYECLTVIDAALAHDPQLVAAARSTIEMSGGIFGAVGTTRAVLDAYEAPPTDPARPPVTTRSSP